MLSSSEKQHHLAEYRQSSAIERRLKAAHERYADACSAAEEVGQTQIHEADTIVQTSKLDRGHLFGSRYKVFYIGMNVHSCFCSTVPISNLCTLSRLITTYTKP